MTCKGPLRNCLGKRLNGLVKKAIVLQVYQLVGWLVYTYIEEGFALTDCLFDTDNIKRLKATNSTPSKVRLYNDLNKTLQGELNSTIFDIYHKEFQIYFAAKEPATSTVDILEICARWYQFTAITLTTVGYGNVVPKTMAGKLVFFPYCIIGIPLMLFFLGDIGKLITDLSSKIVEMLYCRRNSNGQTEIPHKELKSFLVTFILLWIMIIIEALFSHYLPDEKNRLSMVDGVYFFFVSYTTIGYGDITSPMQQPLFEFRLYIGLSLMSGVVNSALAYYQKFSQRREERNRGGKKCFCDPKRRNGSVDIETAEEMVVVKGTLKQKEPQVLNITTVNM